MFERFTVQARQVIVLAQRYAQELRHNHIGTEHLLLGLLSEENGIAARVLASLDVQLPHVQAEVKRIVPAADSVHDGQVPFTPRAKKVLELSLREALRLAHNYIGTEHVLLGLAAEDGGVAAVILRELGLTSDRIRTEVRSAIWSKSRPQEARPPQETRPPGDVRHAIDLAWLDGIGTLLNELGHEIRSGLDRDPDAGDLLLTLACADKLAAATFRQLGIDPETLTKAVNAARLERVSSAAELRRRLENLRQAKEHAIAAQEFQRASELRDEERALSQQLGGLSLPSDFRATIRKLLGLEHPPQGPNIS